MDERELKIPEGMLRRLRAAVTAFGDHASVAHASGVPLGTLRKLLAGHTDPRFTAVADICRAIGLSVDYMVTGFGPESGDWETQLPPLIGEKRIPIRDVAAAAGYGLDVLEEDPTKWLTFSLDWLMPLGDPDSLEIIRVEGDSMVPELNDGDIVMIDRSQRQVKDGLFVLLVDERLFLKRVRVKGKNRVALVSTNAAVYPPFDVIIPDADDDCAQDGALIVGRVVWYARAV